MLDRGYSAAWIVWFVLFAAVEGMALVNKRPGDTLSEHVWAWFSVRDKGRGWRWRRVALVGTLAYLVVHFLTGGGFL